MKKVLFILTSVVVCCCCFHACEDDNCPPNALSRAVFSFVNQEGKSITYTDTLSVIGMVTPTVNGKDTVVYDTIINKQVNTKTLSLPLSYGERTTFILRYGATATDTIYVTHRNTPYFTSIDCGAMMFHTVTGARAHTVLMDSLVLVNPNIDNYEKENFKIYFTTVMGN